MFSQEDEYYMGLALMQAQKALEEEEIPVGAVVVCQGRIVAKAYNQTEVLTDVTAHAEMIAITSAAQTIGAKYLKDCTMYVTLEPCLMCAGALYWSQLGRLVYGAKEEKRGFERVGQSVLHPKTDILGGVRAEESESLLKEFFSMRR
ncbi:nucleoside deaminase [Aquirufa nivalisilvae]|uniref:tRNA-specific adenosine deaminase n=1 Tax=Aquirufa nivalisilvae TaxID=2516557 RepID=A0A2S2DSN0_9BACT|nr:nucleoside deaminase [Aquirufa nivalisilvae]AWL08302.1 tRNA(adenine(34)) deaminase [Aquirufa nivalisilvae]MCZ2478772.1 nucleoside deaminase [Aquirufa nivalisilvae]MCZ2483508.1 nucleoside deaminase [Aquirufa nivalisilvae]TBH75706.1 nucleoside deaminase [Aquirufa nivalisilvae]